MDLFNVESHVGLSLPAAQHKVVDLFGAGPGALQHPALGDALDHLGKGGGGGEGEGGSRQTWEMNTRGAGLALKKKKKKSQHL